MDVLNKLVGAMNKEEVRYFKVYATRITGYSGRKDLQLFDAIRTKGKDFDEKKIMRRLCENDNAYYRLKNRLTNDINDFLALHNFDASENQSINRDWILFTVCMEKRQFELAYFYMKRAEKKALKLENFEMLDLIYNHLVSISNEMLLINPEEYISLQKENARRLLLLREMDQALAALTYRLRITQNWGRENQVLTNLLEKTLNEFTSNTQINNSKPFQVRLYRAVSQVLLQRHQYRQLLDFVAGTYKTFTNKNWFDKETHELKLQMLTYLVNATFRLERFEESLAYTATLKTELESFNRALKDKFIFFYYNALAINYMKTDLQKALQAIEQMEGEMKKRKISYYDQFIYLNKAIVLYWLRKPDAAIRTLMKLYVLDSFKQTDASFRLGIAVAEQIMQYDTGDKRSFNIRLSQLRGDFKEILYTEDFMREHDMLKLLELMNNAKDYRRDKKVMALVKKLMKQPAGGEEKEGVLSYREWLGKKFEI